MADSSHLLEGLLQRQQEQPDFVQAVMQALHLPKQAVDTAANYYSGLPGALDPNQEPVPIEDLAAEAVAPDVNASSSLPAQMGKEGVRQMAGGLSDPMSYAPGLGSGPGSSVKMTPRAIPERIPPSEAPVIRIGPQGQRTVNSFADLVGKDLSPENMKRMSYIDTQSSGVSPEVRTSSDAAFMEELAAINKKNAAMREFKRLNAQKLKKAGF